MGNVSPALPMCNSFIAFLGALDCSHVFLPLVRSGGRRGIVCAYVLLWCFGFPFKWPKQRGGMKVEWIGLFADYTSMKLGLSPKRSSWLSEWVLKVAKAEDNFKGDGAGAW